MIYDSKDAPHQGYMAPRMHRTTPRLHGTKAAWHQGCMAPRLHRTKAAWHQGCMAPRLHGTKAAWHQGCMAPRLHRTNYVIDYCHNLSWTSRVFPDTWPLPDTWTYHMISLVPALGISQALKYHITCLSPRILPTLRPALPQGFMLY